MNVNRIRISRANRLGVTTENIFMHVELILGFGIGNGIPKD